MLNKCEKNITGYAISREDYYKMVIDNMKNDLIKLLIQN